MKLFRSTAIVSAMTMISRILGFARDVVIANMFGAGTGADAFFVAFKIPNFMRRLFAEGAFSQAFVPILSEYKDQQSESDVRRLIGRVQGTLGLVLLLVTILGVVFAPVVITIFAPGFIDQHDKFAMAVDLLRMTFPYLFFISLTALAGGVLNSYGHFAVPAFTPVFLNISLITAAIFLAPHMQQPIMALGWGVFLGGVVQLGFQLPFIYRIGFLTLPRMNWSDSGVRQILKLMGPGIFGVSVSQINLLLDTLIASFLITGSVSWLYYSDRLVEFPLGVFSIALATVILPSLSQKHAAGSTEHFSQMLDWALRCALLVAVPAAVALAIMAGPLLTTLFQYGEFSGHDVQMASKSLLAYSLGLVGFSLIKVLAPGFFARKDTKTPVKIGVLAMASNMILNIILVFPLAHAGLALATSLSALLNAGLLYRILYQTSVYRPESGWFVFLIRLMLANSVMAVILLVGVADIEQWLQWELGNRVMQLTLWIVIGVLSYFLALFILGFRTSHIKTPV